MRANKVTKPRARQEGLIVQDLPDETLVYDLERDRAHCLNQTAALIWRQCDGQTTTREIARALTDKSKTPVHERLVWLALDQLGRNHLLIERAVPPPNFVAMNRRELMRALGMSAAVGLPVVASIVAPMPAQAATGCIGNGGNCAGNPSGCCQGCVCEANTCIGGC